MKYFVVVDVAILVVVVVEFPAMNVVVKDRVQITQFLTVDDIRAEALRRIQNRKTKSRHMLTGIMDV